MCELVTLYVFSLPTFVLFICHPISLILARPTFNLQFEMLSSFVICEFQVCFGCNYFILYFVIVLICSNATSQDDCFCEFQVCFSEALSQFVVLSIFSLQNGFLLLVLLKSISQRIDVKILRNEVHSQRIFMGGNKSRKSLNYCLHNALFLGIHKKI